MFWLAALLLYAQADDVHTQIYFDEPVEIRAGKIRTLDIPIQEEPARVMCSFVVTKGDSGVNVLLLPEKETLHYVRGEPNRPLAVSGYDRRGSFSEAVPERGLYKILIDNRLEARGPTTVQLTVKLAYGTPVRHAAREVPPERRRAIILISLAAFFSLAIPCAILLAPRLSQHLSRDRSPSL